MPIHLPSTNRRQFLTIAGSGAVLNASGSLANDDIKRPGPGKQQPKSVDDELVVFLNDTHVGEKHPPVSIIPSSLRFIVNKLTNETQKPSSVIINGDLALKDGQEGDYQHFSRLIHPLRIAEIETHLTLGNHDNRETFYEVLKDECEANPALQSLHVSIVKTRHANFFLLDSLKETMLTRGTVGSQQMNWLAQTLDEHSDKAEIIFAHHNPSLGGDPIHFPGGLTDSKELWNMMTQRNHVKAYVHGHIHDRGLQNTAEFTSATL